jgi:hypothetical protein
MKSRQKGIGVLVVVAALMITSAVTIIGMMLFNSEESSDSKHTVTSNHNSGTGTSPTSKSKDLAQVEIEKAPAEQTKFSKLPESLQKVAIAEIQRLAPPCVKDGKLVNYKGEPDDPTVDYAPIGSAIIGIGCDGGSAGLFASDKQGNWKYVQKTQMAFSCEAVFTNPVPKRLLELDGGGAVCFIGDKQVSYDEASKKFYY